jgi:hypothetical protein
MIGSDVTGAVPLGGAWTGLPLMIGSGVTGGAVPLGGGSTGFPVTGSGAGGGASTGLPVITGVVTGCGVPLGGLEVVVEAFRVQ